MVKFINRVACNYVDIKLYIEDYLKEKRAEE